MYIRYGHNNKVIAKIGEKVTAGQHVADVGTSGASTGPHSHIDMFKTWASPEKYIRGMSKEAVKAEYPDPRNFAKITDYMPEATGIGGGYDYLQKLIDGSGYHSGIDLNGVGDDTGKKLLCPFDGEVVHVSESGSGWGKLLIIKLSDMEVQRILHSDKVDWDERSHRQIVEDNIKALVEVMGQNNIEDGHLDTYVTEKFNRGEYRDAMYDILGSPHLDFRKLKDLKNQIK